jgi:hypothetical protein
MALFKIITMTALFASAWVSHWGFPWNLPIAAMAGIFAGFWMRKVEQDQPQ